MEYCHHILVALVVFLYHREKELVKSSWFHLRLALCNYIFRHPNELETEILLLGIIRRGDQYYSSVFTTKIFLFEKGNKIKKFCKCTGLLFKKLIKLKKINNQQTTRKNLHPNPICFNYKMHTKLSNQNKNNPTEIT